VSVPTRFASVDELLADARSRLCRLTPLQAAEAVAAGARLVDIRPAWQRAGAGEVPGALICERNHLEWRLHPDSPARTPLARPGQGWIVICTEGYTSSLAADALNSLGVSASDVIGGFAAWHAAGLPTATGRTPADQLVPATSSMWPDSTS
jgi:rhodanese-related sulfurtransferase